MLPGAGTDIDYPVRMPHDIELMLDDEKRVARSLEAVQCAQQRLGVGRMKSRRRFVQYVDDPEQVGSDLGCQAKPLKFAGRQRRRAPFRRQVAETEVEQYFEPRQQIFHDPLHDELLFRMVVGNLLLAVEIRPEEFTESLQRQPRNFGDIHTGKCDRQRLRLQPLAVTYRAIRAGQKLRHTAFHHRALRRGEGLEHVFAGAREGPLVTRLFLPLQRPLCLGQQCIRRRPAPWAVRR